MTTPEITLTPVESSRLHSIGHDPATKTLAVRFQGKGGALGSLYHYSNVSTEDFAALAGAESLGSHFIKTIKADAERFPYQRINESKAEEE